jgi:HEAT repeat protein
MISINASRGLPFVLCLATVGCGGDGVAELIAQLESGDVAERRIAARELAERPEANERVIAALNRHVDDRDAEVRFFLIRRLGQIGVSAKSSLPALEKLLNDPDSRLRVATALAIQRIDPEKQSFVPVLTDAMWNGDGRVLLEVGAMGADAEWAVQTLVGLLSHESPQLRALAAQTLGRIGPAAGGAVEALQRATKDLNVAVQGAARGALDRIAVGLKPGQREGP